MSKETDYRTGIDERPLTESEYKRLKSGGELHRRVRAPKRRQEDDYRKNSSRLAV